MRKPSAAALTKLALLLAFITAAIYCTRFTELGRQISVDSIRARLDGFPPALVRVAYIGIYVVGTMLLLPGTILSFLGALLFGLFEAILYTWIGATVGATLAFVLTRLLGRAFVENILAGRLARLDERLSRHGFANLLILRLVPLVPFNAINFGSGLTSIRLRDYVLATAIGIVPGTVVYQYLFATIGTADPFAPQLLIAIGVFLAFTLLGRWLARRLQASKPRDERSESRG